MEKINNLIVYRGKKLFGVFNGNIQELRDLLDLLIYQVAKKSTMKIINDTMILELEV